MKPPALSTCRNHLGPRAGRRDRPAPPPASPAPSPTSPHNHAVRLCRPTIFARPRRAAISVRACPQRHGRTIPPQCRSAIAAMPFRPAPTPRIALRGADSGFCGHRYALREAALPATAECRWRNTGKSLHRHRPRMPQLSQSDDCRPANPPHLVQIAAIRLRQTDDTPATGVSHRTPAPRIPIRRNHIPPESHSVRIPLRRNRVPQECRPANARAPAATELPPIFLEMEGSSVAAGARIIRAMRRIRSRTWRRSP